MTTPTLAARVGSTFSISCVRSVSDRRDQAAISPSVRKQPTHTLRASNRQVPTQGLRTAATGVEDESSIERDRSRAQRHGRFHFTTSTNVKSNSTTCAGPTGERGESP